jgi:hypothetical protein
MFVAGIADAIAALFGNGIGAIAMQILRSRWCCSARCRTLAMNA